MYINLTRVYSPNKQRKIRNKKETMRPGLLVTPLQYLRLTLFILTIFFREKKPRNSRKINVQEGVHRGANLIAKLLMPSAL